MVPEYHTFKKIGHGFLCQFYIFFIRLDAVWKLEDIDRRKWAVEYGVLILFTLTVQYMLWCLFMTIYD